MSQTRESVTARTTKLTSEAAAAASMNTPPHTNMAAPWRPPTRFSGRDWNTIEPDVRRDWEAKNRGSAWENFKDAVRHGWENVTGRR